MSVGSPAERPRRSGPAGVAVPFAAWLLASAVHAETLTWPAAVAEARANNHALAAARETVASARSAVTAARADFWPSLSANANANRTGAQGLDSSWGPLGSEVDTSSYAFGGAANWDLFSGFATVGAWRRARADLAQREEAFRQQSQAVRAQLRQAFLQLVYDQGNLDLLAAIRDRLSQDARYLEIQYKAGRQARWTFTKARADVADIEWQLVQTRVDLATQQQTLARLLGRAVDGATTLVVAGDLAAAAPPAALTPLFAALESRHPGLRAQVAQVASADAALTQSRSSRYPSLSARASLDWSDGKTWPPDDRTWLVGLTMSFPVFAGGGQEAAVSEARHAWLGSLATLEEERAELRAALCSAWGSYSTGYAHLPVDQLELDAAQERFKTVQSLFEAGQAAYLDFEQAESLLTQAQQRLLAGRLGLAQAAAEFDQALGLTLDDEEGLTP